MRKTLENIVKKAKNSVGKAASMLALGTLLFGYEPEAKSDVIFSMDAKNSINVKTRAVTENSFLDIFVYADNTTENNSTLGTEWTLEAPADITHFSTSQPRPYINNSQTGGETNDFFYPNPMSSTNSNGLQKSMRYVNSSQGPFQKKGWVGKFSFYIPDNGQLGKRVFRVSETKAVSANGESQISRGSSMTIEIIPSYDILTNAPIILEDLNYAPNTICKVPYLHVTKFRRQLVIDASGDSRNWAPIFTNNSYSTEFNRWDPFDFIDKDAENMDKRFYRARTID